MFYIKVILHISAMLGLMISLGEILGVFSDKDRISFVKIIGNQLECDLNHPGAKKFINDFVHKNSEYKKINMEVVEKIVYVGLFLDNSNKETGHSAKDVLSGTLKLRNTNGQTTKGLCTFEELKNWAKESPFWKWFGWGIIAISVLFGVVLFALEEVYKS